MTTTRPYRKALRSSEAIERLEDAAGSQLDPRLVVAFVDGLRDGRRPAAAGRRPTTPAVDADVERRLT